jgi:hypothetical protein
MSPSPLVVCLVLATLVSACGDGTSVPPAALSDPGAAARQAAIERYADGRGPAAVVTPHVLGLRPDAAEDVLAVAGLTLRVVTFDPTAAITAQHPGAGRPAPIDGVVEGWLGTPPAVQGAAAQTAARPTAAADPTVPPQATSAPTDAATAVVDDGADGQMATGYVLPPHTAGLLRINPRRLPAVPLGTQLTGTASWYGPGFHGRQTACGGIYDQNGATLATRELRCGTVVRITGPTGLTVEAVVTDWGPAEWTGRRFDLSAAVFNAIAPLGAGVVPVRVVTANVPG